MKIKLSILSVLIFLFFSEAYGIWIYVPTKDRVCKADLIVIGSLQDVKDKAFSYSYFLPLHASARKDTTRRREDINYYNSGRINVRVVLKGEWNKKYVPFIFNRLKGIEKEPDGTVLITINTIYQNMQYGEGDSGIWILKRTNRFGGNFFIVDYPANFMPMDSLSTVQNLISECLGKE